MTFQRKLLFGVSLMVLPALLIGTEAIRSNMLEQRALATLGERLGRSRTYAELETAMFNQSEVIWRYLTGMDPEARKEFELYGEVVQYWFERWKAELAPADSSLAQQIGELQRQYVAVGEKAFSYLRRRAPSGGLSHGTGRVAYPPPAGAHRPQPADLSPHP